MAKVKTASKMKLCICLLSFCTLGAATPAFAQQADQPESPCLGSTVEMAVCAYAGYHKVDRELNKLYRAILPKLEPGEQKDLRAAQRLWVQFRGADCKAVFNSLRGGIEAPIQQSGCLETLTRQRIAELKSTYEMWK
jgi:uncharacterized protein YecT (DUF1311 family)